MYKNHLPLSYVRIKCQCEIFVQIEFPDLKSEHKFNLKIPPLFLFSFFVCLFLASLAAIVGVGEVLAYFLL